jgi:cation transport ATPase-like protein
VTTVKQPIENIAWYALPAEDAAGQMGVDLDQGLEAAAVHRRLSEYGPNLLPTEPPPSVWVVARGQLSNPMNIMMLIVGGASFAIGQVTTGVVVLALVTFYVVMGSNQELKPGPVWRRWRSSRCPGLVCGDQAGSRRWNRIDQVSVLLPAQSPPTILSRTNPFLTPLGNSFFVLLRLQSSLRGMCYLAVLMTPACILVFQRLDSRLTCCDRFVILRQCSVIVQ